MMQGGGMVPQSMSQPPIEQQNQMAQAAQYQLATQAQQAPPHWGMIPPLAPQAQYPPSQQLQMWNQQLTQVPLPQSMSLPQQPQHLQAPYGAPMGAPSSLSFQTQNQPASSDEVRTLWIGDLQFWMEDTYIHGCFAQSGEVLSVKLIRNRQSGQLEGYGFIEFATRAAAERVLQAYNGTMMPNSDQVFRLNWASAGGKRLEDDNDYTIFVGDLPSDVTDYMLQEAFRSHYPSVKGAKIVSDRLTGRSKGYGFVRFGDLNEQTRAMTEMNGAYCSSRPMRIGPAASKKATDGQHQDVTRASFQNSQGSEPESDPNNTTIFVGGLDPNVTEDLLRQVFSPYGELIHVKIPFGKRCGFVQFLNRACAEEALLMLQGTQLGGLKIRLSWGRNPSNKQQQDSNQWNGNNYGVGQGYEAYGYAQAPQDPNMYAYGAYPGYGNFQQQQ